MKIFSLVLICLCSITVFSQGRDENPPGVTTGKYKWQKMPPAPQLDSTWKAESDNAGSSISPSQDSAPTGDRSLFFYSVEVKNDGRKPIKAIRWDYIVIDAKTSEELGRHEFESFEKVGLRKVKALTARSRFSPSRIVRADQPDVTDKSTVIEKVIVRCVVYEDDTLWEQPGTASQMCEALRRRANK